jgi:hypothetical protein
MEGYQMIVTHRTLTATEYSNVTCPILHALV